MAQDGNYAFMGLIDLGNKQFVSYYLNIDISDDGKITGYSLSDLLGKDETKSEIVGEFDKENKVFKLKETDLLYTKSSFDPDIFCNLHFSLPIKIKKKLTVDFEGFYPDNSPCIKGELKLTNQEVIEKFYSKLIKVAEKMERKDKLKKEDISVLKNSLPKPSKKEKVVLRKDETISYLWKKPEATLEVFDEAKMDGDEIELFLNDKKIFTGKISKTIESIKVNLKEGKNKIVIHALNEGEIGLNTVSFNIRYKNIKKEFRQELNTGDKAGINIFYKKD